MQYVDAYDGNWSYVSHNNLCSIRIIPVFTRGKIQWVLLWNLFDSSKPWKKIKNYPSNRPHIMCSSRGKDEFLIQDMEQDIDYIHNMDINLIFHCSETCSSFHQQWRRTKFSDFTRINPRIAKVIENSTKTIDDATCTPMSPYSP